MKVAVIGAGASGIAALKELSEAGLDVTCFEKGDRVGGIWAFENSSGLSACYRTLHLNTSRGRTEFCDFPMPPGCPDFPGHAEIAAYFDSYVDRFAIRDRIRFECGIERAERASGGGWTLTTEAGGTERFDALVVANGHNWRPRLPDPPYPGEFHGEQLHAHDFRDNSSFAGRRVLVVGMGNSAMDIAVESSWVAERTLLSVRSGSYIVPKYLLGKPADQITKPAATRIPWRLRQPLTEFLLRATVGHPSKYGLPAPSRGFLQDHPTVSDTILHRITHGEVTPKPAIGSLDGDEVVFADGSRERVDTIVWCTGYEVVFPFFDPDLISPQGGDLPLYRRIFHLDLEDVFFIGLIQSTGSAIPIVEQQAKLVAERLTGRYALPDRETQRSECERRRAANVKRYGAGKRPAMRVDFDGYMREIARERRRGARRAGRGGPAPDPASERERVLA